MDDNTARNLVDFDDSPIGHRDGIERAAAGVYRGAVRPGQRIGCRALRVRRRIGQREDDRALCHRLTPMSAADTGAGYLVVLGHFPDNVFREQPADAGHADQNVRLQRPDSVE